MRLSAICAMVAARGLEAHNPRICAYNMQPRFLTGQPPEEARVIAPGEASAKEPFMERVAWLFLCLTCIQLTFLQPYVVLVPGVRSNLFSGLLCLLTLLPAIFLVRKRPSCGTPAEVLVCAALIVLGIMSALFGLSPRSSLFRVLVILSSGVCGFWCARIVLHTEQRVIQFQWFCVALLGGLAALAAMGYALGGAVSDPIGTNLHPLNNVILLLSFGPLGLIRTRSAAAKALGIALLAVGCVVIYLSGLKSALLIPPLLLVIGASLKAVRTGYLIVILSLMAIISLYAVRFIPEGKWSKASETFYYRLESYPFSWQIVSEHPVLGIGTRGPRDQFLERYEIRYPYVTKEKFRQSLDRIVTSENVLLTFAVDMGLPFALIYLAVIVVVFVRLSSAVTRPPPGLIVNPAVLLLPITAGLLHYQIFDGLYYPQCSWFFHILLGLVPMSAATQGQTLLDGQPGP